MKPKTQQQMMSRESLEYYLSLTYSLTLDPDPKGGYVAHIKDLPGCFTQGETLEETMANIQEARELWIETAYEMGDPIPLPNNTIEYSGKFLLQFGDRVSNFRNDSEPVKIELIHFELDK
jgi:antitoxin HicB